MPTSLRRNSICEVYFLVQPCRNRPAEFARCPRCPPVACQRRLLPLPVSVMLIFDCFSYASGRLYFIRRLQVCNIASPERGGGPAKLVEGFFHRYSSQPISQRSKKRKELAYPCTVWQCVARRLHKELRHSTTLRCMSSITKLPARFRAGSFVFCRLYASEFFCEGTAYKLVSHAGIYSWCRIYKS